MNCLDSSFQFYSLFTEILIDTFVNIYFEEYVRVLVFFFFNNSYNIRLQIISSA